MIRTIERNIIRFTVLWVFILFSLNFIIPHSWFFEYNSLHAEDVCQGASQALTGVRTTPFAVHSGGVDQIFPVGVNIASDRFEWDGGYPAGISTSTWRTTINVDPGTYIWKATTLRIDLLYIFPIYLSEEERPVSNEFEVLNCTE